MYHNIHIYMLESQINRLDTLLKYYTNMQIVNLFMHDD